MCTLLPEQVSTHVPFQAARFGRADSFPSAAVGAKQGVEWCIFTDLNQTTAQTDGMGQLFFSLLHSWKLLSDFKLKEARSLRSIVEL